MNSDALGGVQDRPRQTGPANTRRLETRGVPENPPGESTPQCPGRELQPGAGGQAGSRNLTPDQPPENGSLPDRE